MPPRKHYVRIFQAFLLLGCAAGDARAAEAHAHIAVTARVMPVANLQWLGDAPTLRISTDDVVRGTAELRQTARIRVSSNSPVGYTLDVLPRMNIFNAIIVNGMRAPAQLGADGGSITQRWQAARAEDLNLHFTFKLAAGVLPGEYPLPVLLRVRPAQ